MNITLTELQQWMRAPEGEHLEFKEAKQNFHFEKLVKYCAALANEGGGRIVFGVTDKRPRRVVGSAAFADLARTKAGLIERLQPCRRQPDGRPSGCPARRESKHDQTTAGRTASGRDGPDGGWTARCPLVSRRIVEMLARDEKWANREPKWRSPNLA